MPFESPLEDAATAKTSGLSALHRTVDIPFESIRYTRPRWPVAAKNDPSGPGTTLQITGCPELKNVSVFGAMERSPSRPSETPSNLPLMKSANVDISQTDDVEGTANCAARKNSGNASG